MATKKCNKDLSMAFMDYINAENKLEDKLIEEIENEGGFIDTYVRPGNPSWKDEIKKRHILTGLPKEYTVLRVEVGYDDDIKHKFIRALAATLDGNTYFGITTKADLPVIFGFVSDKKHYMEERKKRDLRNGISRSTNNKA